MGGGVRDSGHPRSREFAQAGCAQARRDRMAGAAEAGYDSPWTLPPFRHHEVMIPLRARAPQATLSR